MAALKQGTLFLPKSLHTRCMSKINIQRPRPRHDARRLFEAITKPVVLPEYISHTEKCARKKLEILGATKQLSGYEEFLLKQCRKMLQNNRMIVVCQALPMSSTARTAYRNMLIKKDMSLCLFNNALMKKAIENTAFVNLTSLILSQNVYIVGKEPCVEAMIKTLRKIPEMVLLGGIVDNRLLSKEGLLNYSKLPPIEVLRGQLVSILSSPAMRTRSLMSNHQQVLSTNLDQYIKQSQEKIQTSKSKASTTDEG